MKKIKLPTPNELLSALQIALIPIFVLSAIDGIILVTLFFAIIISGIELIKHILKQFVLIPKASFKKGGQNSLANRAKRFKDQHNKKDK